MGGVLSRTQTKSLRHLEIKTSRGKGRCVMWEVVPGSVLSGTVASSSASETDL